MKKKWKTLGSPKAPNWAPACQLPPGGDLALVSTLKSLPLQPPELLVTAPEEMRAVATVIQLLGWTLVWSPCGTLEILSRSTASRLLGLFLSSSLRAIPEKCP
ncbi:uncharacterized protein WM294_008103 [Sarcoramphus papa]